MAGGRGRASNFGRAAGHSKAVRAQPRHSPLDQIKTQNSVPPHPLQSPPTWSLTSNSHYHPPYSPPQMKRPKPIAVYLDQVPTDDPHAPLLLFPSFPSATGSDPGPVRCSSGPGHLCTHDTHSIRFPTISIKSLPPSIVRPRLGGSPRRVADAQAGADGDGDELPEGQGRKVVGRDSGYESNLTWSNKQPGAGPGLSGRGRVRLSGPVRVGDGGSVKRRQHRLAMHFNPLNTANITSPTASASLCKHQWSVYT